MYSSSGSLVAGLGGGARAGDPPVRWQFLTLSRLKGGGSALRLWLGWRIPVVVLCFSIGVLPFPLRGQGPVRQKFSRAAGGMVATTSPYATEAAVQILEAGGNAMDAAAAAHFTLMVADPANCSLGGRVQILIQLRDGRVVGWDGATEAPAGVPPLKPSEDRQGYAVVPVPGNLAAEVAMIREYGNLKLSRILRPAIELAEKGFRLSPHQAATWSQLREALLKNPGTARNFLKPDGSAYQAGELFVQPRLAGVLRQVAKSGADVFYQGPIAQTIAADVRKHGGFIKMSDLANYRSLPGPVVRTTYRGYQVASLGGDAWGDTIVEMLNILGNFRVGPGEPNGPQLDILARSIAQALADRPQELRTLKPKKPGYPLSLISSAKFGRERAELVRNQVGPLGLQPRRQEKRHDTTHLSVMDAQGNAVALTTSIGPSFGSRMATPDLGFLYAHSYKMRAAPTPNARDDTEMSPTILSRGGRPILAIGAAGSESIPTAILQVISYLIDRGYPLERAVAAPRIFCFGNQLRMEPGFSSRIIAFLRSRGYQIEMVPPGSPRHLGILQAVQFDPASGEFLGAADPRYDGSTDGPKRKKE